MHPAHRKRLTDNVTLWFAHVLVSGLRAIFRVQEYFASGKKQEKLRELRLKMDALEQGKQTALEQIRNGSNWEGLDAVDAMLERHGDAETRHGHDAHRQKMQAMREESDALQAIHKSAGDNLGEAVAGYRAYIAEHPESRSAYSYLGGALSKQKEWDESLKAYREALRLAEPDGISETMAHVNIGTALQGKGEFDAAVAELRLAAETPNAKTAAGNCAAYFTLGNVLNEQGKRAEARAAWKQVIKLDEHKILAKKARELLKENS